MSRLVIASVTIATITGTFSVVMMAYLATLRPPGESAGTVLVTSMLFAAPALLPYCILVAMAVRYRRSFSARLVIFVGVIAIGFLGVLVLADGYFFALEEIVGRRIVKSDPRSPLLYVVVLITQTIAGVVVAVTSAALSARGSGRRLADGQ